jgi:hypothetical protein
MNTYKDLPQVFFLKDLQNNLSRLESTLAEKGGGGGPHKIAKAGEPTRPPASAVLLATCLALDESFFHHLFVAEPQIGDIG